MRPRHIKQAAGESRVVTPASILHFTASGLQFADREPGGHGPSICSVVDWSENERRLAPSVIPASPPSFPPPLRHSRLPSVIPAKAGIQVGRGGATRSFCPSPPLDSPATPDWRCPAQTALPPRTPRRRAPATCASKGSVLAPCPRACAKLRARLGCATCSHPMTSDSPRIPASQIGRSERFSQHTNDGFGVHCHFAPMTVGGRLADQTRQLSIRCVGAVSFSTGSP